MTHNSSKRLALLIPVLMLGAAVLWFGNRKAPEPTIVEKEPIITAPTSQAKIDNETVEFKLNTEPSEAEKEIARQESILSSLPASLRDVPPPDSLDVDENGDLIINAKIRHMFDHYLTAIGEEDIETILERIRLNLDKQLDEPALSSALNILQGYVDYRGSIDQILQASGAHAVNNFDPKNIASLKQQIRISRSQFFSEDVIKSFFEKEDQYDDYMLAKSTIANNNSLDIEEKMMALKAIQKNTPAWLVEQETKANRIGDYKQQEQALRDSGAEDWEIKDFRRRELGDQAAANLEKLDLQRKEWNNRLTAYQDEIKEAMAQYEDTASNEAVARRDQIRAKHFKDNELRRVKSLDQIAAGN